MIKSIAPQDLAEQHRSGKAVELIDVRTPDEYREMYVEFAKNFPLNELDAAKLAMGHGGANEPLYLICHSGGRSRQACDKLAAVGMDVVNVEGGTLAWESAGLPVVRGQKTMSLERQVRIMIGTMVLLSSLLAFYSIYGIALIAFFGAGLIFSGIANFCGLAPILARMPWNRAGNPAAGSPQLRNCCAVPRD